jgi:hypothetical protein
VKLNGEEGLSFLSLVRESDFEGGYFEFGADGAGD